MAASGPRATIGWLRLELLRNAVARLYSITIQLKQVLSSNKAGDQKLVTCGTQPEYPLPLRKSWETSKSGRAARPSESRGTDSTVTGDAPFFHKYASFSRRRRMSKGSTTQSNIQVVGGSHVYR